MGKASSSRGLLAGLKAWALDVCRVIREAAQTPIPRYAMDYQMCSPKLRGVTLRAYRPEDFEACRLIHDLNAPNRFPEESGKQHEEYLQKEPEGYLVAEFENEIIGCGGISLRHSDFAIFAYGLVHPKYQQMGIGRLLFFARVALLPTLETDALIYICAVKASLPYYQKFGFVALDEGWKDASGCDHPTAIMAVNAQIIERARDYLQRVRVPCPDLGSLKPENAGLWSKLQGTADQTGAVPPDASA